MKRRTFVKAAGTSGLLTLINPAGVIQAFSKSFESGLSEGFVNPPSSARPHTYWYWMNGNITANGITRDLEAMKSVGIAGFLCFNVGVAIPKGPVVYGSPQWISLMEHAANEADRLGLEFGMHNSPGWSSTGGPWITPEYSMQKVVWTEHIVTGGDLVKISLTRPNPTLDYYRDTYVIAFPASPEEIISAGDISHAMPKGANSRLQDWEFKAGYDRPAETRMMEFAPFAGSKPRKPVVRKKAVAYEVPQSSVISLDSVIDITEFMKADGELTWEAPAGHWTILRLGHTSTGSTNRAAPDTGQGLECDKLSCEAFDMHFNSMFQHLVPFMKVLANKGRVAIEIDSYEVGMQNWTKGFPEAFKKSRGYDINRYLPAMTGRVVNSTAETEAFLWDLRRVIADMMANNYYGRCAELCKQHNFIFYAEPYKLGPFENLQAGSKVEIAMGEFWSRGQRNKHAVKLASSIQHINGRKIVAAESFTGQAMSSKWQQFPFSMKAQGDYMFTKGLNRMVFHVFAHQIHPTVRPGMTMGQFGTHFDRNNTWFNLAGPWIDYLSRCQFMLQQGLFVADLLYYTGEDAPGEDLGIKETPVPAPPLGYDFDYMNTGVLMNRIRVENDRIMLPDNMSYRLMILPLTKSMSVNTLVKIRDLVEQGMCIMGPKPESISGLSRQDNLKFQQVVSEIWGDLDGTTRSPKTLGLGKVFWEDSLENVVKTLQLKPDFDFSSNSSDPAINFIHRRHKEADIYFISNRRRRREHLVASFRINGRKPELWDAVTGQRRPAPVYDIVDGQVRMPLQLEESGSVFVIFREMADLKRVVSLNKNGKEILGLAPFSVKAPGRYKNVSNNFTISAWIKPECDIAVSGMDFVRRLDISSFVLYPSPGEKLYGKGHSVCGLIAGRNGLVVYERKNEVVNPVLEILVPLSGWTHLCLVYKNGAPLVYINGQLKGAGKPTGNVVHPSVGEEYQDVYSLYFEGDMTPPKLANTALDAAGILDLITKKRAITNVYPAAEIMGPKNDILIWENGDYSLRYNDGKKVPVKISRIMAPTELTGTWEISFPPGLGAPSSVTLPELVSLHVHADNGVKYFSGTASYHKSFIVKELKIDGDNRLYLDLGQVEVLAEVIINGTNLGVLWKRPFRIDITRAVRTGVNSLEIKVTNGWPNRLIGDEQFPEEYSYANEDSGRIKAMPDWFLQGKPKPTSNRITFATWKHYSKDSPLLESGLVGPVTLRRAVNYIN